ncbi:AAA family ATPase [Prolixibacter sp. NT017]|uniref:AAA family ATPase n=1 Tax=Prolixibacter sp. NT017 TaxID=2652390 RepID=UPI00127D00F1|nr:AAA family ATPase [Prolixibacter sp. NT017]GET24945.1 ATP-binding protein [Prolixibacter sp. NT017]
MNKQKETSLSVSKVYIEELFGYYTYTLPNSDEQDISKLLLVYGDNGTGKTTLLNLFFYLLSTKDKSGYKSSIAETKFKKFSIHFNNGIEIGASRENGQKGSYEYYISENGEKIKSVFLVADQDNAIMFEPQSETGIKFDEIINYIKGLNIAAFYLSDDRRIRDTITSDKHSRSQTRDAINLYFKTKIASHKDFERGSNKESDDESSISLEHAIERLLDWVRSKVISGSKVGEKNSQVIFSDIIENYITLSDTETTTTEKNILLAELDKLDKLLPSYVDLGLIDEFDTKKIRRSIKQARKTEQIKFLNTVISPFLEGINAKLEALKVVEKTINLFIETVNDYFTNKSISFNLNSGFDIEQKNGTPLEFSWLSSGEKQLLLLLINTITSTEVATFFIIDEPEISLNIKWQRKLIKTLLTFSADKNIQFILATHSFELLSAYKNNTSKLIDQNV